MDTASKVLTAVATYVAPVIPPLQAISPLLKVAALAAGTYAAVEAVGSQRAQRRMADEAAKRIEEERRLLENVQMDNRRVMYQDHPSNLREVDRRSIIGHLGYDPFERFEEWVHPDHWTQQSEEISEEA